MTSRGWDERAVVSANKTSSRPGSSTWHCFSACLPARRVRISLSCALVKLDVELLTGMATCSELRAHGGIPDLTSRPSEALVRFFRSRTLSSVLTR